MMTLAANLAGLLFKSFAATAFKDAELIIDRVEPFADFMRVRCSDPLWSNSHTTSVGRSFQ